LLSYWCSDKNFFRIETQSKDVFQKNPKGTIKKSKNIYKGYVELFFEKC